MTLQDLEDAARRARWEYQDADAKADELFARATAMRKKAKALAATARELDQRAERAQKDSLR